MASNRGLPTRNELIGARDWLRSGAPAVATEDSPVEPEVALSVLLRLIDALPERIPEYRWDYRPASPAPETRTADPRVETMLRVTDEALARLGAPETRTGDPYGIDPLLATSRQMIDDLAQKAGVTFIGETRTGEGAETPIVRSDWRCEAGTEACPGTQGSLAKEWICVACGRKAHAPKTWRDKGLAAKPPTYEPSGSEKDGEGPHSPSPREGTP